jgi:predicted metal-dependent enzyme (double-stranded beta helix superfamily)
MYIVRVRKKSDTALPVSGAVSRPQCSRLGSMLADIERAVMAGGGRAPAQVAAALQRHLPEPDLLHGVECPSSPDRYMRHLLHAGVTYTVLALVWRTGQMSPVHSHRAWGVVGVHRGSLTETRFLPVRGSAQAIGSWLCHSGQVLPEIAEEEGIHRIANLDTMEALSIHVYNAPYDQIGTGLNVIWAA